MKRLAFLIVLVLVVLLASSADVSIETFGSNF